MPFKGAKVFILYHDLELSVLFLFLLLPQHLKASCVRKVENPSSSTRWNILPFLFTIPNKILHHTLVDVSFPLKCANCKLQYKIYLQVKEYYHWKIQSVLRKIFAYGWNFITNIGFIIKSDILIFIEIKRCFDITLCDLHVCWLYGYSLFYNLL